jgi:hypothetical protein
MQERLTDSRCLLRAQIGSRDGATTPFLQDRGTPFVAALLQTGARQRVPRAKMT